MTDVDVQVRGILEREFLADRPGLQLAADENLIDADIIDSLGIMMLVGFIEKDFGIAIEPEEILLENFETIAAIEGLIRAKIQG
ncbi:MAG: acyl carrier protein [Acidimicrobiales bacterium]